MHASNVCFCNCMYVMYACVYVYMYECNVMHACMFAGMYVMTCVCMHACMYVMYVCM